MVRVQHSTSTFSAPDGLTLFAQAWQPERAPRAIVLLAHGVGEHSGRYQHVAAHLVRRGYAVHALDHRGHGRSAGGRVFIRRFDEYTNDLLVYFEQVRMQHSGAPLLVYGHSMGSIIALRFALRHQSELAGLITTGTALRLPVSLPAPVVALARRLAPFAGQVPVIAPIALDGLSRDPQVIADYKADPLVHWGRMRLGWAVEMFDAAQEAERRLPELRLPYLALHGADDPITLPEGAEIVRERAGSPELTVRVYPGLRHEIHNEPEQAQVLNDIGAWLDARINGRAPDGSDPS